MPAPSQKLLFCYAIIALPLAFAGLPLYIHIPDFYIRQFGLNIGILGVVLLFVRLFDAIQDPFIGYICDKYARKKICSDCRWNIATVRRHGGIIIRTTIFLFRSWLVCIFYDFGKYGV